MRRKFKHFLQLLIVIAIIHITNGYTLGKNIEFKEYDYYNENIPENLNGLKIAFITDTHELYDSDAKKIVEKLNSENIDILLLGGDYNDSSKQARQDIKKLSKIKTSLGIYGTDGNHDNFDNISKTMEDNGITQLANTGLEVADGLYLSGVVDLWKKSPNVQKAIQGRKKDDFVILLSHNPDIVMSDEIKGVDLTFSGHIHGGHITIFGLIKPTLRSVTKHPLFFNNSNKILTSPYGSDIIVSNGTGQNKTYPRIFARPQVCIVTLYNQ